MKFHAQHKNQFKPEPGLTLRPHPLKVLEEITTRHKHSKDANSSGSDINHWLMGSYPIKLKSSCTTEETNNWEKILDTDW